MCSLGTDANHDRVTYRSGVSSGIVAPRSGGFLIGLNTAFSTGSKHKLEHGALIQSAGAVHVSVHPSGKPSVSTQIAALRRLLLEPTSGELGLWFDKIRKVSSIPPPPSPSLRMTVMHRTGKEPTCD